jgi:Family of unknown function (DUF6090)
MIKFFRKIRQKLVTENLPNGQAGKFSKYILYAIGEIILVVIGILIAVSLNNWNQNREHVAKEIQILKEIKSELTLALIDLKDDTEDLQRNLNSAVIIYNSTLLKENYNDSLRIHFLLSIDREKFTAKQSAFESLKSVGLETISNDSTRAKITDVYLNIGRILDEKDEVFGAISELETILNVHLMIDREMLLANPQLAKKIWWGPRGIPFKIINYEALLRDEKFLYTLLDSMQWRRMQIFSYEGFGELIQNVINDIEEELKRV